MSLVPILDENDLRAGLRDATSAAPAAPAGRVERSIRRARHIRLRRAVGSVMAVAAIAVAVPALVPDGGGRRVPADMAAAVREWPAHREHRYRAYEQVALDRAWLPVKPGTDGWTLHRLYTGDLPVTSGFGNGHPIAVAFAVCREGCYLALMVADPPDGRPPADSGWVRVTGWVAAGAPTQPVAWLLDGDFTPRGITTLLVVLPPANAATMQWNAPTLAGTQGGTRRPKDGLFAVDAGFVAAEPTYTLFDGNRNVIYAGPARMPGSREVPVGRAEAAGKIELPSGFRGVTGSGEQLDDGKQSFPMGLPRGSRFTLFFRCLGRTPVLVRGDGLAEMVQCDGQQHTLLVDRPAPPDGTYEVTYESESRYTSYQAELAVRT